jgi:hypothetical protein
MSGELPDKMRVHEALLGELAARVTHMTEVAKATADGATHAEARPENDKDTRALEQSYLARGQALRVEELVGQREVLRFMPLRSYGESDPLGAGALALLESADGTQCLFIAPHAGGTELLVDGVQVRVITPQSALGALLLGRSVGDDVELRVKGEVREYVIAAVR